MKKWKIIGIIAVALVIIVLSFAVGDQKTGETTTTTNTTLSNDPDTIMKNAQSESASVKASEKKEPNQIDVPDYLELKAGSEAKIILLARPTCGYCQIAEPILYNIAYEYDLEINYLNSDNFTEDDEVDFIKSDELFSKGYGTPYLFIVKDDAVLDSIEGMTDRAHYIEFFKHYGIIE